MEREQIENRLELAIGALNLVEQYIRDAKSNSRGYSEKFQQEIILQYLRDRDEIRIEVGHYRHLLSIA